MLAAITARLEAIRSLEMNLAVAQIFGVPLFLRETSQRRRYLIIFYCLICLALFNFYYLYCEVLDLSLIRDNFNHIAQNVCLTVTHFGGNFKFLNIMLKLHDVKIIVEEMRELPSFYVRDQKHQKIFRASEIENKLIVIVYSSLVMSTAFLGFGTLLKDPSIGGNLFPYRALLPDFLSKTARMSYWSIGTTMLAIQIVAIDCLNVNLINQIRLHLKLLNLNLSELASTNHSSKDALQILKGCIKHHQIILRLRNDIENIFKYPVLAQFSVSLLIFVMTGFQAIVLTGSDGILLVYFYCACITCQLFSYCWFANQVMEENKFLVIAGYNTSWFDFGARYSKILIMFMINAQRPLTFTVGGFFNLSLNAFTGILSRSYSFIAVLRQVYAK